MVNFSQGSSLLATLGFEAESLRDSSVRAAYKDACKVQRPRARLRSSRHLRFTFRVLFHPLSG